MTPDPESAPAPAPSPPPAAPTTPAAPTPGPTRPPAGDVEYKGAPLDPAKGPGLGCFWLQVIVLVVVVVLTPLSAAWSWPIPVTIVLFALTLVLLLFVGQTVIFLLRLVAADRRAAGRRVPLRSETKTVGELEDASPANGGDEPPGVRE
ncbi:MAG TPA: hypothetical protein VJ506_00835 [Candidatus Limnocylindrales bacterium]|nr:hypothetical protein [Candidatus Limnocylindrales bacterium]